MHRIDGPAAAPGGLFTEGDPTVGTPATVLTDDWANAVQEELCAVIAGAGIALNKPNNAQVLVAIQKLVDLSVPVGTVKFGYFSAAEPGFLLMQGQLVSRAAYPRLYAAMSARGFVIADGFWTAGQKGMFSDGDGTTTFRLPDLRGEFIRVADMGRGVDVGRLVGTWQDEAFKAHAHEMGSESGGGSNLATPVDSGGVDETAVGGLTSQAGGTETRPRNVALTACVRF